MLEILNYFPSNIKNILSAYINENNINFLEEIRIRVKRNIILKFNKENIIIDYIINTEDILNILQRITENSIYSYQKQICEGFITLKGGHRVGISGNVVIEDNKVININYVYSLNFRIAKQIIGVANDIIKYIYDGNIYNTLIVSPPRCRKNYNFKRYNKNIKYRQSGGSSR